MRLPIRPNIQLGITDRCNLACYMCRPSLLQSRKKNEELLGRDMSIDVFRKIVTNLSHSDLENIMLCWVGEPFLHPDFSEMISILRMESEKRNFFRVLSINTNATLFNHDICDRFMDDVNGMNAKVSVVFSLDAVRQETFKKIKKNDLWNQAYENTIYFFQKKKKLGLTGMVQGVVQLLVLPENEAEVLEFYYHFRNFFEDQQMNWELRNDMDFALDNGIVIKKVLQRPQSESEKRFLKAEEKLSGVIRQKIYGDFNGKIYSQDKISEMPLFFNSDSSLSDYKNRPPCISPFLYPAVHVDGRVTVCCRDNSLELVLGNLTEQSFDSIWWGEKADKIRKAHLESDLCSYPLCYFCENFTSYFFDNSEISRWYGRDFDYMSEPVKKKAEEKITELEKIFHQKPDATVARMLNEHYQKTGNNDKLRETYEFLHRHCPDNHTRTTVAHMRMKAGEFENALKIISEAEISEEKLEKIRVRCLIETRRYAEAESVLENFDRKDQDLYTLMDLAECYKNTGKTDKLLDVLEKIMVQNPEQYELSRAYFIHLLCTVNDADQAYSTILRLNQEHKAVNMADLIYKIIDSGDYEKALKFSIRFYQISASDDFLKKAADCFRQRRMFHQAICLLSLMYKTDDREIRMLAAQGKTEEAVSRAIAELRNGGRPDLWQFLFFQHFFRQEYAESLCCLRHFQNNELDFRLMRADVLEHSGKLRQAALIMKKMTGQVYRQRLSWIYLCSGRYFEALEYGDESMFDSVYSAVFSCPEDQKYKILKNLLCRFHELNNVTRMLDLIRRFYQKTADNEFLDFSADFFRERKMFFESVSVMTFRHCPDADVPQSVIAVLEILEENECYSDIMSFYEETVRPSDIEREAYFHCFFRALSKTGKLRTMSRPEKLEMITDSENLELTGMFFENRGFLKTACAYYRKLWKSSTDKKKRNHWICREAGLQNLSGNTGLSSELYLKAFGKGKLSAVKEFLSLFRQGNCEKLLRYWMEKWKRKLFFRHSLH